MRHNDCVFVLLGCIVYASHDGESVMCANHHISEKSKIAINFLVSVVIFAVRFLMGLAA